MLYLFKCAKYVLGAFCVLFVFSMSGAQASMITLVEKPGNPADELVAVIDAFQSYSDNDTLGFDYNQLIYLGKLEPGKYISTCGHTVLVANENPATPISTFTLRDPIYDEDDGPGKGELLTASVGFGPELMVALLVVDGKNTFPNLYFDDLMSGFDSMFSNVVVGGGNKAISHLSAFGYLPGSSIPSMVPVPAVLPLFGAGIVFLGLLSGRWKRRAS